MKFRLVESQQYTDNQGNNLSPEQVQFFRNSKIRDERGNLLVCYHGTQNPGFTSFNPRDSKSQFGKYKFNAHNITYFTTEKNTAIGYTNLGVEENGNVYACYLNITNPYVVDNETEDDIKSWKTIKDSKVRAKQIEKFETEYDYWKNWIDEDTEVEELNEWLNLFNVELRPSKDYDDCYDLWQLESNTLYGKEHIILPSYTLEELFDDDMYEEFRDAVIGDYESEEYKDDYWMDIDTIIKWVLYHNSVSKNNQYDGIIVSDVLDVGPHGSPFDGNTTDIVSFDPRQIKSITNKTPSNSSDINEKCDIVESTSINGNKYGRVLATYSNLDFKNIMSNSDGLKRIIYDSREGLWLIGDAQSVIHRDLIGVAYRNGAYKNQEEYIRNNCMDDWEIYYEVGDTGEDYVHDYIKIQPYIFHFMGVSQNFEVGGERYDYYKSELQGDGYNEAYLFDGFYIFKRTYGVRGDLHSLEDVLIKNLGQPQKSIKF